MFSFDGSLSLLSSEVWACGVFVPQKISEMIVNEGQKRLVCTLNNQVTYQCALMPYGDGQYFVNVNKALQKKLKIEVGDLLAVELDVDNSQYGLPMPEELAELMHQDEDGYKVFHTLSAGKQRTLIHLCGVPKSSEIRLRRALVVIEYLKDVNGKLDFKELNLAIKASNQGFK